MSAPTREDLIQCAAVLAGVHEAAPRVHCITNSVVQTFTANALLAVGAIPSMTINPEEIADFVRSADALLINLGTVDAERMKAIPLAFSAAREAGIPVVLDPVFVDRSPGRARFARDLAARKADIIRANAAEWSALGGPEADADAGPVVQVVTGETDRIVGAGRRIDHDGGHALMARVTGIGCVQSALMAALAARSGSAFHAALAGLVLFGLCGERAARQASGPGTFEPALLDAFYAARPADLSHLKEVS
ncbi:MAG: hydroxyethylthiazole kinase [Pseudomonadota bacterium]